MGVVPTKMFTREYLDNIIDTAYRQGGTEVEVDGPQVADSLVNALLDRVESVGNEQQTLSFSGVRTPEKYTLTVVWCGPSRHERTG